MSKVPPNLYYTETHEWVKRESQGESGDIFVVGITDYAQSQLGDIVYVDLPEVNSDVDKSEEVAVVESVKTAADIYAPLTGSVVAINEDLADQPALINTDPYGKGWLYRIQSQDRSTLERLLSAADYQEHVEE